MTAILRSLAKASRMHARKISPKTFYSTKQQLKIKTNRDKVVASDLTVILMTGFDFTLIKSTWLSIDDIGGLDTGP